MLPRIMVQRRRMKVSFLATLGVHKLIWLAAAEINKIGQHHELRAFGVIADLSVEMALSQFNDKWRFLHCQSLHK
jgi:hypothetical protein